MDKGEKVLIIDDDEMEGECLRDLLQLNGFEVSYYNDGRSALALSQAMRFNVIITDYQMPGLDGLEVTKSVRSVPRILHGRHQRKTERTGIPECRRQYVFQEAFFIPRTRPYGKNKSRLHRTKNPDDDRISRTINAIVP